MRTAPPKHDSPAGRVSRRAEQHDWLGALRTGLAEIWWGWIWRGVTDLASHDAAGLAGELAYRVFVALLPGILTISVIFGIVARAHGAPLFGVDLQRELGRNLPPDAARFLAPYLTDLLGKHATNVLSFGVLFGLWSVSSVITTVMKATTRILHLSEHRSYVEQRLQALVLSAYLPVLLLLSFGLAWFRGEVRRLILGHAHALPLLFPTLRLSTALALAVLAIALLLHVASPRPLPRRLLLLGAVASVAGLWLASEIFVFYAGHLFNYRSTYGLLGGALALLTWLYVGAFCLLVGIEVMALAAGRKHESG